MMQFNGKKLPTFPWTTKLIWNVLVQLIDIFFDLW